VLAGFLVFDVGRGGVNVGGEGGNFEIETDLFGVHAGHAAGEGYAEAATEFVAEGGETFGLGGLALEAVHLAGDFVEDVIDPGEVLPGAFEAELGEALFGFEAGDAGGFFDDGAAVVGLGAGRCAPGR